MRQQTTADKKVSYARWPKSFWNLQIVQDDSCKATGVMIMSLDEPDFRIFGWKDLGTTIDWVQSNFKLESNTDAEELVGLLALVRDDYKVEVKPTAKPVTDDELDMPLL